MKHCFVTWSKVAPPRWREAFPEARVGHEVFGAPPAPGDILWLHAGREGETERRVREMRQRFPAPYIVVLSNIPSDEEGIVALDAGAHGYCNAHADPEVLHRVAEVVGNGGLWVGETLLGRLLYGLHRRMNGEAALGNEAMLAALTERERVIALRIARGESNKEVARDLGIAERTVKAHLSAVFDKLGVRDRLQLALLLNGVA